MTGGWMRRQPRARKDLAKPARKRVNVKEVEVLEAIEAAKNELGHRPRLPDIAAQVGAAEATTAKILTELEQVGRVARGVYDARSYRDQAETTPRKQV